MTILEIFNEVREWALSAVKSASPIKTGKLRDSFQLIEYEDGWGIRTTIDYMVYTEMKWTYNSHWEKTLQNPNEAWFRNVAIVISEELARRIGGVVYVIS